MNKIFMFLTFAILNMGVFVQAEHPDSGQLIEGERIYITLDQLQFHDNNMYVLRHGDWCPVYALYSDGRNLYIESKQASPETWYCSDCRTYHNVDQKCPQTGKKKER
jgi:hypothetical protein